MRKLFVSLLAVAALAACSNEDVVRQPESNAIRFDGMFVENATRAEDPSLTKDNLTAFDVWGFMNETTAEVFNGTDVTRMGDMWYYDVPQYWLKGNTYYFAALAPMNSQNVALTVASGDDAKRGLGKIAFTNVDGSEDLIYASTSVKAEHSGNEAVKFTFNHLLSKIKFTFINGFAHDNITVDVENVKMVAPKSGTIDLAVKNWWDNDDWKLDDETLTLEFGNVERMGIRDVDGKTAAKERLTIPATADYAYAVSFIANVYVGDQKTAFDRTATIEGAAFEMGKAYNLVATISPETLDLEEIVFEVVEVKEWIEQDMNCGEFGDNTVFVSTIGELQAALDAATGDTTISLGADLKGNVTVTELKDATIAIYGNGKKFDGTFALVGGSTYGKGTTVFDGINFETAALDGYDAFIYCNEQNGNTRYPDNVTIKNCTFKGTDAAVAAKFRSLNGNLVVENCKAEGIHSMLQLLSCGEAVVLVDDVEVVDCGRGFSLQNSTNIIRNTNVKAASYGVRLEGGLAATSIENSTIEATQPVIVRKLTTAGYTVNVDDASVLNTTEAYQVVFTKGADDATYVAPEVDFTFNGPAAISVFPNNSVATVDALNAALQMGEGDVILEADVNVSATATPWVNVNREVAINTNENTLTVGNAANYGLFCNAGSNVTLDADIVAQGGAIVARDGAQVVFNSGSVKIESSSTSQRYVVYAYGAGTTVTINDGTFSFEAYKKRAYGAILDGAVLYINGGVFGAASNHPTDPTSPFVVDGGQVIITGGTFGFNPSAWVADGYVATQNGSTWTVSKE